MSEKTVESHKLISMTDVLGSKTKFKIYGMLRIYPELSLSELSKKLKKSRSTIHEHLQTMLDSGIITKREEDDTSRHLKTHLYSLNILPDSTKECCKNKDDLTPSEKAIRAHESLSILQSFTEQQVLLLNYWEKFLKYLENLYHTNQIEELSEILQDIHADNMPKLLTVEFYTKENAKKFRNNGITIHNSLESDETSELKNKNIKIERPYYGGITLLPLKYAIDYLSEASTKKKQKSKN